MTAFLSFMMALFTYLTAITTAIPTFLKEVKGNPDFTWMVTASETREVSADEYYDFYQKNYHDPCAAKFTGDIAELPDNTELYQALLDENLKTVQSWKELPAQGQINFFKAVQEDGIWNYKVNYASYSVDANGNGELDWPSYDGKYFLVYGVIMDWEVLGNLNYAFTGCALGFTPVTIKAGGGFANIMNTKVDWDKLPYYFDNEDDLESISFGIALYSFIDENYVDNARMIDALLTIADPRIFNSAVKIYRDLNMVK